MRPCDLERLRQDATTGPWQLVRDGDKVLVLNWKGMLVCTTSLQNAPLIVAAPDMVRYIVDDKSGYSDELADAETETSDLKEAIDEATSDIMRVVQEIDALFKSEMRLADKIRDALDEWYEKTVGDAAAQELHKALADAIVELDDLTAHTEGFREQADALEQVVADLGSTL